MKKTFRILTILTALIVITSLKVAQAQPHPGHLSGGGSTGGAPIAGAPVGSGVAILITLAAAYCGRKVYDARKNKSDQM